MQHMVAIMKELMAEETMKSLGDFHCFLWVDGLSSLQFFDTVYWITGEAFSL